MAGFLSLSLLFSSGAAPAAAFADEAPDGIAGAAAVHTEAQEAPDTAADSPAQAESPPVTEQASVNGATEPGYEADGAGSAASTDEAVQNEGVGGGNLTVQPDIAEEDMPAPSEPEGSRQETAAPRAGLQEGTDAKAPRANLKPRTIPAPTIIAVHGTAIFIGIVVPDAGDKDGLIEYGWATSNSKDAVQNWQPNIQEWRNLDSGTVYYVFARITGGIEFEDAYSTGIAVGTQEALPAAEFAASGTDSGTLTGVEAGMEYSTDGGATWTPIIGITAAIGSGVTAANGIQVVRKGNGTTTDSAPQTIAVTQAPVPSLVPVQPGTIGGTGSIPMDATHEYSADSGVTWTQATGATELAPGTYLVRVKAAGTVLASPSQTVTVVAFAGQQEPTPAARFTAIGPDSGILTNTVFGMEFSTDGGTTWKGTDTGVEIASGLTAANGIQVVKRGNGATTTDSDIQYITLTQAPAPSLVPVQPGTIGGTGSIPMDATHEYSADSGVSWKVPTAGTTELAPGTYLVRVKAAGTVLASPSQTVTINPFNGTQEQTPAAFFRANGPDSGILGGILVRMEYSTDGGATWTGSGGANVYFPSGLTTANGIQVIHRGNGATTTDSDIQYITLTQAAAPSLVPVQPGTIGGTGSIPTDTTHEYSSDSGATWTQATGATELAPGTYLVRVKASGTVLASPNQTVTINPFAGQQEPTPAAAFDADGPDSGVLTGVEAGMEYSTDGGATWTPITGTTAVIGSGVTAANGIQVIHRGNTATTTDSDIQNITLTKGAVVLGVAVQGCTTADNSDGRLTGVTAAMEYSLQGSGAWQDGTGADITGLAPGTYLIRTKASGTALAGDASEFFVAAYTPALADAPKITAGATQSVTQGNPASFTSDADISGFLYVTVDGERIAESNYTVSAGSIIVTLNAEYLKTLALGEHSLGIVSAGGVAQTTFTVLGQETETSKGKDAASPVIPEVGDAPSIQLCIAVLLVSCMLAMAAALAARRKMHGRE